MPFFKTKIFTKQKVICLLFGFFSLGIQAQEGNIWYSTPTLSLTTFKDFYLDFNIYPSKWIPFGTNQDKTLYPNSWIANPTATGAANYLSAADSKGKLKYFAYNKRFFKSNMDSIGFSQPHVDGHYKGSNFWKNDSTLIYIDLESELQEQNLDTLVCGYCPGTSVPPDLRILNVMVYEITNDKIKKHPLKNARPLDLNNDYNYNGNNIFNVRSSVQNFWDAQSKKGFTTFQIHDSLYVLFFNQDLNVYKTVTLSLTRGRNLNSYLDNNTAPTLKLSHSGDLLVVSNYYQGSSGYFIASTNLFDIFRTTENITFKKEIYRDSAHINTPGSILWIPKFMDFDGLDSSILISLGHLTVGPMGTPFNGEKLILCRSYDNISFEVIANTDREDGPRFRTYYSIKFGSDGVFYLMVNRKALTNDLSKSFFAEIWKLQIKDKKVNFFKSNDLTKEFYGTNNYLELIKIGMHILRFPETPGPYKRVTFTAKNICAKNTWQFTNTSDTQYFVNYRWYIGENDSFESNNSNLTPKFTITKPGNYLVKLRAFNSAGGWIWYGDSIEVEQNPIANFGVEQKPGCQWIAYTFTDSSVLDKTRKKYTWHWNYGDGSADNIVKSKSLPMPQQGKLKHTYNQSGKFTTTLIVTDSICWDTFTRISEVDILPAPRPGIVCAPVQGCTPLKLDFQRKYSDAVDSVYWQLSKEKMLLKGAANAYTLQKPGTFWLKQSLYGPTGCVTQDSIQITAQQGLAPNTHPYLVNATHVSNQKIQVYWQKVPFALGYSVYRQGLKLGYTQDTVLFDNLGTNVQQSQTYTIVANDSCGNPSLISNKGKTVFLTAIQAESADKNKFGPALLTWTPYEDWANGVQEYEVQVTENLEMGYWQVLAAVPDTQVYDNNFEEQGKYKKCYRVQAHSKDGIVSLSNSVCLYYAPVVFVPDAITPNGDGLNDELDLQEYGFESLKIDIYNRWGQKVWESNGIERNWKPGNDILPGAYVLQITAMAQGKEYKFRNTITVLR